MFVSPRARGRSFALLLAASLAPCARADEGRAAAMVQLECSTPNVGGTTVLTVRSPLVGAPVAIFVDGTLGPLLTRHPSLPVLALSANQVAVGIGTIGPNGRFSVAIATPPPLTPMFAQALLAHGATTLASSYLRVLPGNNKPASFTDGSAGLPAKAGGSQDVDWVDLDKDGCLDAVVLTDTPVILMGDCTTSLRDETLARVPAAVLRSTSVVAVGDVNGDSWPDLFLGGGSDAVRPLPNSVLLNDRSGRFVLPDALPALSGEFLRDSVRPGALPAGHGIPIAAELGDVDGDGDLDLLVANSPDPDHPSETADPVTLYRNVGGGGFVEVESFGAIASNEEHGGGGTAMFGDVDSDGDLDVFVCGTAQGGRQPTLYVNDGRGNFSDATAAALPVTLDNSFDAVFGDFDLDGDLDLFVANSISSDPVAIHLLVNVTTTPNQPLFIDGSAGVPPTIGPSTNVRLSVDAGDVDGDGDLDLVVGVHEVPGGTGTAGHAALLLNVGGLQGATPGSFMIDNLFAPGVFVAADVAFGDVDRDGDLDLYLANSGNLFQTLFDDELWINQP
jgi:hypothetical protein